MLRFKTDENLPREAADLLRRYGHEVQTVHEEGLAGASDRVIMAASLREKRILLTLDTDVADLRRYRPQDACGILVFRLKRHDKPALLLVLGKLIEVLAREDPTGKLWIIDERKIRIRD
ncbi:MAG: hypothetical protein OZSIB_0196 [Candidatus Ozemobacter sibiricus]|uniref:DUF5615 domain-containing protein n=1 Tax=Candidatus Ozemobacter sibiricus TaxID=2268124 RepID=A0A367ZMH0_9BACT|nr:MAG: hypothetical protein OZSIB_0196 [Candidatus Ozemobacter sibiricus]